MKVYQDGIVPLNLPGWLREHGIGVRSGCFCAHTYVKCLLHVSEDDAREVERQILNRDRSRLPGVWLNEACTRPVRGFINVPSLST